MAAARASTIRAASGPRGADDGGAAARSGGLPRHTLLDAFAAGPAPASSAHGASDRSGHAPAPDPRLAALTDRERDVLAALGRGLSNQEISTERFISGTTTRPTYPVCSTSSAAAPACRRLSVAREAGLGGAGATDARLVNQGLRS